MFGAILLTSVGFGNKISEVDQSLVKDQHDDDLHAARPGTHGSTAMVRVGKTDAYCEARHNSLMFQFSFDVSIFLIVVDSLMLSMIALYFLNKD